MNIVNCKYLVIISVLCFVSTGTFGSNIHPVLLTEEKNYNVLPEQLFYLEDPHSALNINQVAAADTAFRKVRSKAFNFGYTTSTIWLKLTVNNSTPQYDWRLLIDNPNLESLELYEHGKRAAHLQAVDDHVFIIEPGIHTYILKVSSCNPLHLPVRVAPAKLMQDQAHAMDVWQGVYIGIILAFAICNFFVYFAVRERAHLYYGFFIICAGLMFLFISGYLKELMHYVQMPALNKMSVFSSLGAFFQKLFLIHFLNLNPGSRLRKLFYFVAWLFAIPLLLEIFGLSYHANISMELFTILDGILSVSVGIIYWLKGYRPARILTIAWSGFMFTIMIFILKDFDLLPYNVYTQFSPQLGSTLEAILLSFALAGRFAFLKKQKEKAEENEQKHLDNYNQLVHSQNEILRATVKERTRELERSNNIKDKFFSIVAHDLRAPLASLKGFITFFKSHGHVMSKDELKMICGKLYVAVDNTIDLADNLLVWAKSQMNEEEQKFIKTNIVEITGNTVNHLRSIADTKRICIINLATESHSVLADRDQLSFILRNLVSNAIKFTNAGGRITISTERDRDEILIKVSDTGIGMTSCQLARIFTMQGRKSTDGTIGEKGTGLGLMLCKEFVEKNNGSIRISSTPDVGTEVIFSLKAAELLLGENVQLINAILDGNHAV